MSTEPITLTVHQARNQFSQAVNRAAFGSQMTAITRGRNRTPATAIVPATWIDNYKSMLDAIDGQIAARCLAEIQTGQAETVALEEVRASLSL